MENETLNKDGKNETGTNVGNQEERTWTQSQLEAIVQERLDRERAKYSDYEDVKAKAQKYDEAEEANKTELEKATEKATALQAKLDAMEKAEKIRSIKAKAAEETGVPASLLHGEDEPDRPSKNVVSFNHAFSFYLFLQARQFFRMRFICGSNLFSYWILICVKCIESSSRRKDQQSIQSSCWKRTLSASI